MNSTSGKGLVSLSIYWQRPMTFDAHGRAKRRHGNAASQLSWDQKMLKDILGVYHVGVVVHGVEYAFGNSHAPHSRRLGGATGGVVAHDPGVAGPQNVFKDTHDMGLTSTTEEQADVIADQLSAVKFCANSYHRLQHNCVDFAQEFCSWLGVVAEFPAWCHRGLTMARLMGFGGGKTTAHMFPSLYPAPKETQLSLFSPSTERPERRRADSAVSDTSETCALDNDIPDEISFHDDLDRVRPPLSRECPQDVFDTPSEFGESSKPLNRHSGFTEPHGGGVVMDVDAGFCVTSPSVWSDDDCGSIDASHNSYPSLLRSLHCQPSGSIQKASDASTKQARRRSPMVLDIDNLIEIIENTKCMALSTSENSVHGA